MAINSTYGVSLSGLTAASTRMQATAHNVANVNTEGFKAQRTIDTPSSAVGGGVTTRVEQTTTAGPVSFGDEGELVEQSNVDIANETVQRVVAAGAYEANLAVVRELSEMDKVLFTI